MSDQLQKILEQLEKVNRNLELLIHSNNYRNQNREYQPVYSETIYQSHLEQPFFYESRDESNADEIWNQFLDIDDCPKMEPMLDDFIPSRPILEEDNLPITEDDIDILKITEIPEIGIPETPNVLRDTIRKDRVKYSPPHSLENRELIVQPELIHNSQKSGKIKTRSPNESGTKRKAEIPSSDRKLRRRTPKQYLDSPEKLKTPSRSLTVEKECLYCGVTFLGRKSSRSIENEFCDSCSGDKVLDIAYEDPKNENEEQKNETNENITFEQVSKVVLERHPLLQESSAYRSETRTESNCTGKGSGKESGKLSFDQVRGKLIFECEGTEKISGNGDENNPYIINID